MYPYVINGFWDDDAINSQVWGLVHRFNLTLNEYIWISIMDWMKHGRILLAPIPSFSLLYFIHNDLYLRLTAMGMLLLNVGLFIWILRKLKASVGFIGVFLVCLFGLFHIIRWHDPISGFVGLYPVLGIELS